jgi:L-lactate dehydrogenase
MANNQHTTGDAKSAASERYSAQDLITFSTALLQRAGLAQKRAATVAEILVEADLMGHTTHGLQLLPTYLQGLEAGTLTKEGDPILVADQGSAITWDGRYLPGPWLTVKAIELACERIKTYPVVTMAIRHSHHIACLAAYPKRVTDQGLFMLLATSDPSVKAVAPYGGLQPLYTPNPLAAGIPTYGDPIILDISMSTTTMGLVTRLRGEGERLPHQWILDNQGNPSDNPVDMVANPPGTILPLGGIDLGHKGFALGLLIEALTSALAGHGRSDEPKRWGASVFLQVIDPQAFGGRDYFLRETTWFADAARSTPTRPGSPPVRLPGSRALELRAEQLQNGVTLYSAILPALQPWSEKLDVPLPTRLSTA